MRTTEFIHAHAFIRDTKQGALYWVSSGGGCQSLRQDRKGPATVNDCHAENLCLKAFRAFLWSSSAAPSRFFRRLSRAASAPLSAAPDRDAKLALRRRYELVLYTSKVPCGECSTHKGELLTKSRKRRAAQRVIDGAAWDGAGQGASEGRARIKPVRKDTAGKCISLTLSCTDKLLRTQFYGVQGNYLSNIYAPLYLSELHIAGDASEAPSIRSALQPGGPSADLFCLGTQRFSRHSCRSFSVQVIEGESIRPRAAALSFGVHYSRQSGGYTIEFISAKTGLREGATLKDRANDKCASRLSSLAFAQQLRRRIGESPRLASLWSALSAGEASAPPLKHLAMPYYCLSTRLKALMG